MDEERIYSGSFDKRVCISDPFLCSPQLPPFFQQCMAFGSVFDDDVTDSYKDTRDQCLRTTLMACAHSGSFLNAARLLQFGCAAGSLTYTNPFGESALFYALRGNHWNFITQYRSIVSQLKSSSFSSSSSSDNSDSGEGDEMGTAADFDDGGVLQVAADDYATVQLLENRAAAGDRTFFETLFRLCGDFLEFPQRQVVAMAIRNNHTWLLQMWKDVNAAYAL